MLSRKDYFGLCHALADGITTGNVMPAIHTWLGEDNPKFDKVKFDNFLRRLIEEKQHAAPS